MRSYDDKEDSRSAVQTPVAHLCMDPWPHPRLLPEDRSLALTVLWVMTNRCSKAPSKVRSLLTADPCWMLCVMYGWPSLPGPR